MATPLASACRTLARHVRLRLQRSRTVSALAPVCLLAATLHAQDWPQIALSPHAGGFSFPVHITHAGDGSGRLFVVELSGRIKIIKGGVQSTFLDIV